MAYVLKTAGTQAGFQINNEIPIEDLPGELVIGDFLTGFEGFLWRFQIWFSVLNLLPAITFCDSVVVIGCIQDCGLLEVLVGSSCVSCDGSCEFSCRNQNNCNLCMDDNCTSCDSFETCEYCGDMSYKYGEGCVCFDGYYMSQGLGCKVCPSLYLEILCLDRCPLGYKKYNKECKVRFEDGKAIRYIFNKRLLEYRDLVLDIEANFYKIKESNVELGILPVYQRGIFLSGNQSYFEFPKKPNEILMCGLRFYLCIWINPQTLGHVLEKINESSNLITVNLDSSLSFSVIIDTALVSTSSDFQLNIWQHIQLSLSYNHLSTISIHLNTIQISSSSSQGHIEDLPGGSIRFGSESSFSGFIYSIHLYVKPPILNLFVSLSCESCEICPTGQGCLSACNITNYNTSIETCEPCLDSCTQGCRHSSNCSLCSEPFCLECFTFESRSCLKCDYGFELVNETCVKCEGKVFYNGTDKKCQDCKGLCQECENDKMCITCKEFSSLNEKYQCVCDKGYYDNKGCVRRLFNAAIEITSKNSVSLKFSEQLQKTLTPSQIKVSINNNQINFSLIQTSPTSYNLLLNFQSPNKNSKISIIFSKPLTSKSNSLLSSLLLQATLYSESTSTYSPLPIIKKYTRLMYICSIGIVLGGSLISFDPNCLYYFFNSVELFTYTLLFNLTFEKELEEFLKSTEVSSNIPSAFDMVDYETYKNQEKNFINFGMDSYLIFRNSRVVITVFFLIVFIHFLILIFSSCDSIKFNLLKFAQLFRFRVYLRFWLQTLLELFIGAVLGIFYFKYENGIQVANLVACFVVLVI